jgi:hypothetical protein
VLALWQIWTFEKGLLEAKAGSKEGSSTEKKEANTTDTGSVSGSGMSDEVLSVNVVKS